MEEKEHWAVDAIEFTMEEDGRASSIKFFTDRFTTLQLEHTQQAPHTTTGHHLIHPRSRAISSGKLDV